MKLSYLVVFLQSLNLAVDSGKYDDITASEIENHITNADLIEFLSERLGKDVDVGVFKSYPELGKQLITYFESLQSTLGSSPSYRKGLCQLIEWTALMILHRQWS